MKDSSSPWPQTVGALRFELSDREDSADVLVMSEQDAMLAVLFPHDRSWGETTDHDADDDTPPLAGGWELIMPGTADELFGWQVLFRAPSDDAEELTDDVAAWVRFVVGCRTTGYRPARG